MKFADLFSGARLEPAVMEFYDRVLRALQCLTTDSSDTATATTGTARTLAYQFGQPPAPGSAEYLRPRSLLSLPRIYEDVRPGTPGGTGAVLELDALRDMHRCPSAGFYSNLGEEPFRVQLVGADGGATEPHTLPPGATVQVGCFVSRVLILPGETDAHFQVYLQ